MKNKSNFLETTSKFDKNIKKNDTDILQKGMPGIENPLLSCNEKLIIWGANKIMVIIQKIMTFSGTDVYLLIQKQFSYHIKNVL